MTSKRKQFIAGLLTICMTVTTFGLYGGTLNVSAGTDLEQKEIKYVKVDDISPYRSEGEYKPYDEMEGYVFAGWYENEDETAPIGVDKKDNSAYAKLVPKEVMNVQAQISATLIDDNTGNDESGAIRFVTTVDSNKYQEVGFQFRINGGEATERTVPTAYKQLYIVTDNSGSSQQEVYPKYADSVGCNVSKYFVAYGFKNVRQDEYGYSIEAKPFWVTLDGTTVYGEAVTKTVNQGIFGTTWTDPLNMSCHTEIDSETEAVTKTYVVKDSEVSHLYNNKAMSGNTGISADLSFGGRNVGITVRVGNDSWQFLTNTQRQSVFMKNHIWNDGNSRICGDFSVPDFDADAMTNIKGIVKDGYFYLFVNEQEAFCANMAGLFPGYDKNSQVSMGVCGLYAGGARFQNMRALSLDEITNTDTKQWGYYSNSPYADSYNFEEGSFQATTVQWNGRVMPLLGKSKTWQVTGAMERTNDVKIGMGFRIRSGEKELRLLGFENGMLIGYDGESNWPNMWIPEKWRTYLLNDNMDAFFGQPKTRDSINYKAVIFEDVLYVWFDGKLGWHVPLTDNELYNFDAGSDYELALYVKTDDGGFSQMTNLKVKMGYQVTEQTEFTTDSNGKSYSFTETMDILQKTLGVENSGMILEEPLTGTYRMPNIQGSCLLYSEKKTGECGLSTNIAWQKKETWWQAGTFISVRIGSEERLFMAFSTTGKTWDNGYNNAYNNGLFYLTAPKLWTNKFGTNGDVWSCAGANYGDGGAFTPVEPYTTDGTSKVIAYVQDGYFHIKYNGQELVNKSMRELFPEGNGDYDANTSLVSIGIGGLDENGNEWDRNQATFSNTTFYYGDISALVSE